MGNTSKMYYAYLFNYFSRAIPGLILLGLPLFVVPGFIGALENNVAVTWILILILSYFIGVASRIFSWSLFVVPMDRIIESPYSGLLRGKRNKFDNSFRNALQNKLEKVWGKDIATGEEGNLVHLCYEDIQNSKNKHVVHFLIEGDSPYFIASFLLPSVLYFLVSLYYLYTGMMPIVVRIYDWNNHHPLHPEYFSEVWSLLTFNSVAWGAVAVILLIIFITLSITIYNCREEFARTVYRTWYVLYREV